MQHQSFQVLYCPLRFSSCLPSLIPFPSGKWETTHVKRESNCMFNPWAATYCSQSDSRMEEARWHLALHKGRKVLRLVLRFFDEVLGALGGRARCQSLWWPQAHSTSSQLSSSSFSLSEELSPKAQGFSSMQQHLDERWPKKSLSTVSLDHSTFLFDFPFYGVVGRFPSFS